MSYENNPDTWPKKKKVIYRIQYLLNWDDSGYVACLYSLPLRCLNELEEIIEREKKRSQNITRGDPEGYVVSFFKKFEYS